MITTYEKTAILSALDSGDIYIGGCVVNDGVP